MFQTEIAAKLIHGLFSWYSTNTNAAQRTKEQNCDPNQKRVYQTNELVQKLLTRWTPCGVCTTAGLSPADLALPPLCSDESALPASFHFHYATHSGPRRPAGSLDRKTSCSWNLRWPQSSESLFRWRECRQHSVKADTINVTQNISTQTGFFFNECKLFKPHERLHIQHLLHINPGNTLNSFTSAASICNKTAWSVETLGEDLDQYYQFPSYL